MNGPAEESATLSRAFETWRETSRRLPVEIVWRQRPRTQLENSCANLCLFGKMSSLEKADSSQALMSLVGNYGDDDVEEAEGIDNISGSDDEHVTEAEVPTKETGKRSGPPTPDVELQRPAKLGRKATQLVSYGAEDDFDDAEDPEDKDMEDIYDVSSLSEIKKDSSYDAEMASTLSSSVQNLAADDIKIPAEPQGKCPKRLQDKIIEIYEKQKRNQSAVSVNEKIQRRKDFRNPSIYEKLISYIEIDEKGTNYPPEIYDPTLMGPESYYDELAKIQKVEMDKREKEKKDRTKIEFVMGTKKAEPLELKRKSKWDAQPSTLPGVRPAVVPPTVLNPSVISVSATGTKTTVISAVGTIAKKPVK